jgi:hypothetical protein
MDEESAKLATAAWTKRSRRKLRCPLLHRQRGKGSPAYRGPRPSASAAYRARVPGVYDACARGHSGTAAELAPDAGGLSPPARGAADLRSVAGFVLEGELELGAIGDRPALVQVNVLLDDLGHPQIAERPAGGPDRLRRRVFP